MVGLGGWHGGGGAKRERNRRMSGRKCRQQREKGNARGRMKETKNWGLKSLKEGRETERAEMEVCGGEKEDEK